MLIGIDSEQTMNSQVLDTIPLADRVVVKRNVVAGIKERISILQKIEYLLRQGVELNPELEAMALAGDLVGLRQALGDSNYDLLSLAELRRIARGLGVYPWANKQTLIEEIKACKLQPCK